MLKGEFIPFFQAPLFEVERSSRGTSEQPKQPKTIIEATEADIACLKLAKAGYGGGNPEVIGEMSPSWVMKLLEYENFCGDYEDEYHQLNRKDG